MESGNADRSSVGHRSQAAIRAKLIACDLDGTLLRPDGTASTFTRDVLTRTQAAGLALVLVTARPPRGLGPIATELGVEGFAICSNGALIFDVGRAELAATHPLPHDVAARIISELRSRLNGVAFACEMGLRFGYEPAYLASHELPSDALKAVAEDLATQEITKLIVKQAGVSSMELLPAVTEVCGTDAVATFSGGDFIEVGRAAIDKGVALAALCADFGVRRAEVIAFGDMPNDISMLSWAGRSVAVANAHPAVLRMATDLAASNAHDGVAQYLDQLLRTRRAAAP